VSLVYPGSRRGRTGADGTAYVGLPELKRSANYRLLADGWVYPTFYSKLYFDFRDSLAAATRSARSDQKGLWAKDLTNSGFTVSSETDLTNNLVILPKLFRRLAEYLTDADGNTSLSGFKQFLGAHNDDELYTTGQGQYTTLDTLVEVSRRKVTLTVAPEDIVFIES
jgi:hypothetical protein